MHKRILFALVAVALLASVAGAQTSHVNKLTVGPTAFNTGAINLAPSIAATGGIYFGSDVTLYRSAANVLKTDDSLTVTGTLTTGTLSFTNASASGTWAVTGATTLTGDLAVNGNTTLGNASTDTITATGRLIVRSVTDAGPMTATAGSLGEIVFNTSNSKFYGCTVAGDPATWSALN